MRFTFESVSILLVWAIGETHQAAFQLRRTCAAANNILVKRYMADQDNLNVLAGQNKNVVGNHIMLKFISQGNKLQLTVLALKVVTVQFFELLNID